MRSPKEFWIEQRAFGAGHKFIVHEKEIDSTTPIYWHVIEVSALENCKNNVIQQLMEVTKREAISLDCARAASDEDTGNGAEPFPKVITIKGEQYRHRAELDRWMRLNACQSREISILMDGLKSIEYLSGHNALTFKQIARDALAERLAEYERGRK